MAGTVLDTESIPGELFCLPATTELGQVLDEALELVRRTPAILTRIDEDRDVAALSKKAWREADARWARSHTACFPEWPRPESATAALQVPLEQGPPDLQVLPLEQGRPRMPAELAYVFLVLQGYLGSVTDRRARDLLQDSLTVHAYLQSRALRFPGWSTILENVNAVSVETRSFILDAQLAKIRDDDLDDFSAAIVDSTATRANSAWPTDGRMLVALLARADRAGQRLQDFGLPNLRRHWVPRWLRKARGLVFRINIASGKRGARRQRKKYYRRLLQEAEKILDYLLPLGFGRDPLSEVNLLPSQQALLAGLWGQLQEDLINACIVFDYTEERIFEERTRPAKDKLLSLGDPTAAYIEKGNRSAVIGYKPELARSAGGFLCALIVEEGNVNDASQLVPLVDEIEWRTGVRPKEITADDGYAVEAFRDQLLTNGVDKVYLCGAKAKAFTDEDEWASEAHEGARRGRSAVESVVFVLKSLFGFDQLRRRGLEAVRAELLSKAVAYNFYRMGVLRRQAEEAARKAA